MMEQNIWGIEFKNPVIAASGTFGFGKEYNNFYEISKLGGICSKGLTLMPKFGNEGIRIVETPSGIMNSIGLENPGIEKFLEEELPRMKAYKIPIFANIGGSDLESYLEAIRLIDKGGGLGSSADIIELNISCPNVKQGGMAFGMNSYDAGFVTRKVREVTKLPLVVKLSPNAYNLVEVAKAVEDAGADGISLINTFNALDIDIKKRKSKFENIYAGLSGPAIRPIALRMVRDVSKNVAIPVIGIGGIEKGVDAIAFIMAGAHLIQFGTASFINPMAGINIVNELEEFMVDENIKSLSEIRGIV
ncbi:MAG: dihydroorotate dehydrogenase [Filifactoraceae bacterium]